MSSGRLGALDLIAVTDTLLYTVPAGKVATVNLSMCNRNDFKVDIRAALVDGLLIDLADEDYFEYDSTLCDTQPLERSGIVMGAGQSIIVYSDTSNVSAVLWGWEETE
jgi:hypothetical protein